MTEIRETIERARKAQQLFDRSQNVQLEIVPGLFAPHEWASEEEAQAHRETELNAEWERWLKS